MVRGWEATNGYNPLRIGLYDHLVSPGEQNWDVSQRQFPLSFNNYDCSLAKALGLTYLVLGSPLERLPGLSTLPIRTVSISKVCARGGRACCKDHRRIICRDACCLRSWPIG